MEKELKVSVLGAGNGGQAVAGHLAMKGVKVNLFDHQLFEKNIEKISKKGGIELCGALEGFGEISLATTDIKKAIKDTMVVILVIPSHIQETFIEMLAPYLDDSQIIMLIPGNFGAFIAKKILNRNGKNPIIVETNTLPYACLKKEEGVVDIFSAKSFISISSLPATNIKEITKMLNEFFVVPLRYLSNSLELNFMQMNMILHNTIMIFNAGRIESTKGNFKFYWDGATEGVCKIMEMMDKERMEVGKKLHLEGIFSVQDWFRESYNLDGKTLHELITKNPGYSQWPAPETLKHRYLTEEVPNLLVPVSCFGKLLDIQTPTIDSIIRLASVINNVNYFENGRNLETLGFSNMTLEDILEVL